jgi:voltage-gated potassium channel
MVLGEGIELFSVLVPRSLAGKTLEESKLTTRAELCVIGMQQDGRVVTNPAPSTQLAQGTELYIMGGTRGREAFIRASGRETKR